MNVFSIQSLINSNEKITFFSFTQTKKSNTLIGLLGQYKTKLVAVMLGFSGNISRKKEKLKLGGKQKYLCFCSRATEVRRFVARELPKEIVDFTGLDIFGKASDE